MSGKVRWPYDVLGLEKRTQDKAVIRKAYAKQLKGIDQAKDPDAVARLREAYEAAIGKHRYVRTALTVPQAEQRRHRKPPAPAPETRERAPEQATGDHDPHAAAADAGPGSRPARAPETPAETPQPEIDPIEADLARLRAAIGRARRDPFLVPRLFKVLDDPAMAHPEVVVGMEYTIFEALRAQIDRQQEDAPRFSFASVAGPSGKQVPVNVMRLFKELDKKYAWFSDIRSATEKLPGFNEFMFASYPILSPQAPTTPRQRLEAAKKGDRRGLKYFGYAMLFLVAINLLAAVFDSDGDPSTGGNPINGIVDKVDPGIVRDLDRRFLAGQALSRLSERSVEAVQDLVDEHDLPKELGDPLNINLARDRMLPQPPADAETRLIFGALDRPSVDYVSGVLMGYDVRLTEDFAQDFAMSYFPSDGAITWFSTPKEKGIPGSDGYALILDDSDPPTEGFGLALPAPYIQSVVLRAKNVHQLEGALGLAPGAISKGQLRLRVYPRSSSATPVYTPTGAISRDHNLHSVSALKGRLLPAFPFDLTSEACREVPLTNFEQGFNLRC